MAAAKPKSLALLAMMPKRGSGGGPDEGGEPSSEEGGGGIEDAMSDLLEAIKADDPKAMGDAFQAAMDYSG